MNRKSIFFLFLILANLIQIFPDNIVNRILYKKVIIKYNQQSIINVYLNPLKPPVKDVFVYFNNKEIKDVNKNLVSYNKNNSNFLPSLSFEVEGVKKENFLELFIVLNDETTLNYDGTITFEKGLVLEEDNFVVKKNQIFFLKVNDEIDEGIYYSIKVDNQDIINKLEEIVFEGILYYRLKSKRTGSTKLKIFRYDSSIETQNDFPYKIITIISK